MKKYSFLILYSVYILLLNVFYIHRAIPSFGFGDFIIRHTAKATHSAIVFIILFLLVNHFINNRKKLYKLIYFILFSSFILLPELTFLIEKLYQFKSANWYELSFLYMQTNPSEAEEAIGFFRPGIISFILLISCVAHFYIVKNLRFKLNKLHLIIMAITLTVGAAAPNIKPSFFSNRAGLYSTGYFRYYLRAIDRITNLNANIKKNIKKGNLSLEVKDNKKKNIVLIIGESLTKDRMSLFNLRNKTTNPKLSKRELIKFSNSYANHVWTVKALSFALTEASQYNSIDYYNANTIIDVAKKSGLKTHWYSNQATKGRMNAMITVIADSAENTKFTDDLAVGLSSQYDSKLLEMVQRDIEVKNLSSNDSNLIVFHLIGNHFLYCKRFPSDFMPEMKATNHQECYDKSVLYNDVIVDQIIDQLDKFSGDTPLSVFYFSDHGVLFDEKSDLGESKRMVSNFKRPMAEIPMIFWSNKSYRENYPNIINNLSRNSDKTFTNDLIFNLMAGLLNVGYGDSAFDLTSDQFNITKPLTNHGRHQL